LYNPALAGFDFNLQNAWVSNSPSNTRRRLLLMPQGQDQIVIGLQVRRGDAVLLYDMFIQAYHMIHVREKGFMSALQTRQVLIMIIMLPIKP
jgi:hypothetical protein